MLKIALCGSMTFWDDFISTAKQLQANGVKPLLPDFVDDFITNSNGEFLSDELTYNKLINSHIQNIKNANAVLVINGRKNEIDGYVGANTILEIGVAYAIGLPIFLLRQMDSQPSRDVVLGTLPVVLDGDVDRIDKIKAAFTDTAAMGETRSAF